MTAPAIVWRGKVSRVEIKGDRGTVQLSDGQRVWSIETSPDAAREAWRLSDPALTVELVLRVPSPEAS